MNQSEQKNEHSKGMKPIMPDFVTLVRLAITVILLVLAYTISVAQLTSACGDDNAYSGDTDKRL